MPENITRLFEMYQPQRPITAAHFIAAAKTRRTIKGAREAERLMSPWKLIEGTDEPLYKPIDGVSFRRMRVPEGDQNQKFLR